MVQFIVEWVLSIAFVYGIGAGVACAVAFTWMSEEVDKALKAAKGELVERGVRVKPTDAEKYAYAKKAQNWSRLRKWTVIAWPVMLPWAATYALYKGMTKDNAQITGIMRDNPPPATATRDALVRTNALLEEVKRLEKKADSLEAQIKNLPASPLGGKFALPPVEIKRTKTYADGGMTHMDVIYAGHKALRDPDGHIVDWERIPEFEVLGDDIPVQTEMPTGHESYREPDWGNYLPATSTLSQLSGPGENSKATGVDKAERYPDMEPAVGVEPDPQAYHLDATEARKAELRAAGWAIPDYAEDCGESPCVKHPEPELSSKARLRMERRLG